MRAFRQTTRPLTCNSALWQSIRSSKRGSLWRRQQNTRFEKIAKVRDWNDVRNIATRFEVKNAFAVGFDDERKPNSVNFFTFTGVLSD